MVDVSPHDWSPELRALLQDIARHPVGRAKILVAAEGLIAQLIAEVAHDERGLLDMIRMANDQVRTQTIELWMQRHRR